MAQRGETLSETQLSECRPLRQGKQIRAYCPFHGGDHQRSLSVDAETGRFYCFACQIWGYMDWARKGGSSSKLVLPAPPAAPASVPASIEQLWAGWRKRLPGSPAADYLAERRIPLELAVEHGLGFAPPGEWPQRAEASRWPSGRLIIPHTNPAGEVVNLYSRAVGNAPKHIRHDHLAGPKGYFAAAALQPGARVWVCEGPLDALSLLAAGAPAAVAIFGVEGWRMAWMPPDASFVFALDSDPAGQAALSRLGRQLRLRGRPVDYLDLGAAKDVNEAWVAGTLRWDPDDTGYTNESV